MQRLTSVASLPPKLTEQTQTVPREGDKMVNSRRYTADTVSIILYTCASRSQLTVNSCLQ